MFTTLVLNVTAPSPYCYCTIAVNICAVTAASRGSTIADLGLRSTRQAEPYIPWSRFTHTLSCYTLISTVRALVCATTPPVRSPAKASAILTESVTTVTVSRFSPVPPYELRVLLPVTKPGFYVIHVNGILRGNWVPAGTDFLRCTVMLLMGSHWNISMKFKYQTICLRKVHMKMTSTKWRLFCFSLDMLTHWSRAKWPPFCRRLFKINFFVWQLLDFDSNFVDPVESKPAEATQHYPTSDGLVCKHMYMHRSSWKG